MNARPVVPENISDCRYMLIIHYYTMKKSCWLNQPGRLQPEQRRLRGILGHAASAD
jgi:hypothetical protein